MKPSALMRRAVLAALAVLGGCASAPTRHLLSLPLPSPSTFASAAQAASQPASVPALVVRRIGIPEYLQTDKVRYRQADSLLAEWPQTAWAERLEVGLTDHLVMRLRLALPGWAVCERSCSAQASPLVLNVDFAPLDYVRAAGQLRADAHWQLAGKGRHSLNMVTTQLTASVHPDSAEGQAAALAQVLDNLANQIATALHPAR